MRMLDTDEILQCYVEDKIVTIIIQAFPVYLPECLPSPLHKNFFAELVWEISSQLRVLQRRDELAEYVEEAKVPSVSSAIGPPVYKYTNSDCDTVDNLRKRGIRINAVGLKSHFVVGQTLSLADQLATKKAYIKADLDVIITGLDIRFAEEPYYTANMQEQQAADYYLDVQRCLQAGHSCLV
ncbi:Glycoside hydrolase, family 10 [Penicillium roqueforti FM164]|uniref:endo-1,4-beta-xylanase n=1 Tax=Penicillium roqueforti (strain FM164) TaxID=1365484 RepID=W6QH30_PENRF|nr:Glycoside hydrolase, family 10 [Penicillium roqueforti FM164]